MLHTMHQKIAYVYIYREYEMQFKFYINYYHHTDYLHKHLARAHMTRKEKSQLQKNCYCQHLLTNSRMCDNEGIDRYSKDTGNR